MKTLYYKIDIALVQLFLLVIASACSNFTDVELPSSQLTAGAVFEDRVTANAAVTDIYSKIRDKGLLTGYPTGLSNQLGLYSDELQYYGISGTGQANFYNNSLTDTDAEISELWNSSYNQIYAANAVVEGLAKSATVPLADRHQLTGEALFVRALIHFYLFNTFGPVPYITSTDYKKNSTVARMPEQDLYSSIRKDLEQAAELLPRNYVSADRSRPNRAAAQALLSRLYLYNQLWDQASNTASAVINQTDLYIWPSTLDLLFEKESRSTIWQLTPSLAGANTYEGNNFIFLQGPPPSAALSNNLLNAFTTGDRRKTQWIKSVTNGTSVWYHSYKYKRKASTAVSAEYSVILRIAEQYLIRSEARAHQGDLIGAKEDLNKTRNLAGLGNTTAGTAQEIIEAVLLERRLELFTELGHRFFDLKRTGKLDQVLSISKPQWKTSARVLPLPESELQLNPNLNPQNESY
ncbi:RagB/SusD family nutrient uptake outer membrane protein [Flavobacterium sp. LC2016-01]|uniref:RagB/SusD family nutrient uptake outer membrane protein n=1 Tax=Flavobacterium sp. LC2016-01 TaxID=2675876 RepID=UPI0012BA5DCE|nr:RagB/SusD family nutrient uptake outer membrane protein [Flavobacterium sp. LC2016-01]MTH15900.1 RagB/SusD family nutrient uptake outer membrane protein [Flavobacterium sp. LC2016-01]